jgi:DNA-binding transcriptional MerR regulator
MYTIKEAASRTGVPVASLRAWERRYRVVQPQRTESGYRLYDERAIVTLSAMRQLVEDGWSPATAAAAISKEGPESVLGRAARPGQSVEARARRSQPTRAQEPHEGAAPPPGPFSHAEGPALTEALIDAAAAVDAVAIEAVLDRGFALGTFEAVVDGWLMPALRALGEAWAEGDVDVAGEHTASYAVMRRLGQSFAAASSLGNGPRVLVGLPGGAHHELGALAFATAARRRGLTVVYVGADLPVDSWKRAVHAFPTEVAVLAVPTLDDRPKAIATVRALLDAKPGVVVAVGGACAHDLGPDVVQLPESITAAAQALEELGR